MPFGAGYVLAKNLEAGRIVDPRPHAVGSLKDVFMKFQHLKEVLPAMGYSETQIQDLEGTVLDASEEIDCVITGTPINLSRVVKMDKPCIRARYRLDVTPDHLDTFTDLLLTHTL